MKSGNINTLLPSVVPIQVVDTLLKFTYGIFCPRIQLADNTSLYCQVEKDQFCVALAEGLLPLLPLSKHTDLQQKSHLQPRASELFRSGNATVGQNLCINPSPTQHPSLISSGMAGTIFKYSIHHYCDRTGHWGGMLMTLIGS